MELKCTECSGTGIILIDDATLGGKLRAIRMQQGIGVREAARRAGMSPTTIVNIETKDATKTAIEKIKTLADLYGVSLNELF
mgnify:CR=1 FL=1